MSESSCYVFVSHKRCENKQIWSTGWLVNRFAPFEPSTGKKTKNIEGLSRPGLVDWKGSWRAERSPCGSLGIWGSLL